MEALSDMALVAQVAVLHNKRAFDQIVRKYQSAVRRFLLNLTLGNEALSDDLAQDTFLKAYTHITQFRGTASLQTWLFRIAYNVYYDHKRSEKGLQASESLDTASPLLSPRAADSASPSLKMDIYHALSLLKEEERTCITLQMIDGQPIEQIAKVTGISENTVKSHLHRGKQRLATFLKQNGYDD
ncbi:MAG: sigma-70 family RNA polymerase sigma factor [Prevotella sp.]|nr:sigma-70 family RNA polymerase sigma factor [Prevotella sp.]